MWQGPPSGDYVYPRDPRYRTAYPEPNPRLEFVAIYVATQEDLARIADRWGMDHLYYDLTACSSVPSVAERNILAGDLLYQTTAQEREAFLGASQDDLLLYKAYVPAKFEQLLETADTWENTSEEVTKARASGLCLTVGAGAMLGRRLVSNQAKVPITVVDDSLVVDKCVGLSR